MNIRQLKIYNYKSFLKSDIIEFSHGFNVIAGQNNVGKTALLEAASLNFPSKPHLSLITKPHTSTATTPSSQASLVVSLSGEELYNLLIETPGVYGFPLLPQTAIKESSYEKYVSDFFKQEIIEITFFKNSNSPHLETDRQSSLLGFENYNRLLLANISHNSEKPHGFMLRHGATDEIFTKNISPSITKRFYSFKAERLNVGLGSTGDSTTLQPDASNLPEVLHVLQSRNPKRYKRYNHLLNMILPSISEARIVPIRGNQLEINLVLNGVDDERDDLLIPLRDSGTGVSQVLAILYVAATAEFPQIILVDEPNSFLNPGASRSLIEILKRHFPQHQYIISTHSPEVIRAASPCSLTLLRRDSSQTLINQLSSDKLTDISSCLSELGARLSDVFGADKIMWVEGPTEEQCFSLILNKVKNDSILGLTIVPVRNTGDLDGKKASMALDLYMRVSSSNALLPPLVSFVLDRERKTDKDIEDISRRFKKNINFIPRRMYENYLLYSDAITYTLNNLPSFRDNRINISEVDKWIQDNGNNQTYIENPVDNFSSKNDKWVINVNAAKLLKSLFHDLSEGKEYFSKTTSSVQITRWICDNKPHRFDTLRDYLLNIIEPHN